MQLAGNLGGALPRKPKMASLQACQAEPAPATKVEQRDPRYPARLLDLARPPMSLWVTGRLPAAQERSFAIVGARAATRVGCQSSQALAYGLARKGAAIVSGGAFGIDAAAHEGALAANAVTFAVLGCGTDIIYPDRHKELFARVAIAGGLLSEYPPGTKPRPGQFPARNRIIAALADAVIVVEAAFRSGALGTAARARDLGRPLFAVPGSPGTDALLHAGRAYPATSADEVEGSVQAIRAGGAVLPAAQPCLPSVQGPLASILDALSTGANTPADLCKRTAMALPAILAILAEAELEGFVKRTAGNTYEVIGYAC
jgi:DNA processing protein